MNIIVSLATILYNLLAMILFAMILSCSNDFSLLATIFHDKLLAMILFAMIISFSNDFYLAMISFAMISFAMIWVRRLQ